VALSSPASAPRSSSARPDTSTSRRRCYAKEVQNRQGRYGEPFPALPESLIEPDPTPQLGQELGQRGAKSFKPWSGRRDLNAQIEPPSSTFLEESTAGATEKQSDDSLKRGHMAQSLDQKLDVEASLARALDRASEAGRWDVVSQLARELEARRLAKAGNVVTLTAKAKRARQ